MEVRHSNARLSLYEMGDAPKRRHTHFCDGRHARFHDKRRRAPEKRVSPLLA
jgi:hypothetical protein